MPVDCYDKLKEFVLSFCKLPPETRKAAVEKGIRVPGKGSAQWVFTAEQAKAIDPRCGALVQDIEATGYTPVMRYVYVALVVGAGAWQPVRPGLWYHESQMAAAGSLAPVRVVAVRVDPALARFSLDAVGRHDGDRRGWSIDRIGVADVVAFNAGQFTAGGAGVGSFGMAWRSNRLAPARR